MAGFFAGGDDRYGHGQIWEDWPSGQLGDQPQARSIGAARRFIGSSPDWDRVADLEVVVLLVSEVVTNVVIHAGPHGPGDEIVVGVHRTDDLVRVEVADGHPGFPVVGSGSLGRASGWGLLLLDVLATAWGVVPNGPGKVVWFEVQA